MKLACIPLKEVRRNDKSLMNKRSLACIVRHDFVFPFVILFSSDFTFRFDR